MIRIAHICFHRGVEDYAYYFKIKEKRSKKKRRKLRGPINYPKFIGGIGFQTEGFEAPMMSGVAFGDLGQKSWNKIKRVRENN